MICIPYISFCTHYSIDEYIEIKKDQCNTIPKGLKGMRAGGNLGALMHVLNGAKNEEQLFI